MKRASLFIGVALACFASAAVGFWFGFREALPLGLIADWLPRGVISTQQLSAMRAGNTKNLATDLEFNVDAGLVWGYDLFDHPLRPLFGPLWGFNVYPDYEKYATRLADYRKNYPSPMSQQDFSNDPRLDYGAKLHQYKLNSMVERYASKP